MMPRARTPICAWAFLVALLAATLTGCDRDVPVALDSFRDGFAAMEPSEETTAILDDAFGFWGVSYSLTEKRGYGILNVTLVQSPGGKVRGTAWRQGCHASVVATENPDVLRHELGHVWLLDHVADRDVDNLMSPDHGDRAALTDEQLEQADRGIDSWLACAGVR